MIRTGSKPPCSSPMTACRSRRLLMKIALVAQYATPLSEAGTSAPDAAPRPDASAAHAEDDIRLRNLSRGLAAGGHDVTVYAQRPDQGAPARTELCPGVRVEYIGPSAGRDDTD